MRIYVGRYQSWSKSVSRFRAFANFGSPRCEGRIYLICGYDPASIGIFDACLHLTAEPWIISLLVPLAANVVAHKIAQQLRARAVVRFCCRSEGCFQLVLNAESEGRIRHVRHSDVFFR